MTDFMNQCGDIRLDMNAEYRSKLIWKLELAAFLDAGIFGQYVIIRHNPEVNFN